MKTSDYVEKAITDASRSTSKCMVLSWKNRLAIGAFLRGSQTCEVLAKEDGIADPDGMIAIEWYAMAGNGHDAQVWRDGISLPQKEGRRLIQLSFPLTPEGIAAAKAKLDETGL